MFSSVYVDASEMCNDLRFMLGSNAVGTTIPTRSWDIKVQYFGGTFRFCLIYCNLYLFRSPKLLVTLKFLPQLDAPSISPAVLVRSPPSTISAATTWPTRTRRFVSGGPETLACEEIIEETKESFSTFPYFQDLLGSGRCWRL